MRRYFGQLFLGKVLECDANPGNKAGKEYDFQSTPGVVLSR